MEDREVELHLHIGTYEQRRDSRKIFGKPKDLAEYRNLSRGFTISDEGLLQTYLKVDYIEILHDTDDKDKRGSVSSLGMRNNVLIINLKVYTDDEEARDALIVKLKRDTPAWEASAP